MGKRGKGYERDFAKALSLWYSKTMCEEIRDDVFWHTGNSGARATTRMKKGMTTANAVGDIGCQDLEGKPFTDLVVWELKRGYTLAKKKNTTSNDLISLLNMIDRPRVKYPDNIKKKLRKQPVIIRWMKKLKREARQNKIPHPILIFRRDRKVSCIVLQDHTFRMLQDHFRPWIFPHDGPTAQFSIRSHNFIVMRFEDFCAWCPAAAFFGKVPTLKRPAYKVGKFRGMNINNFPKGFV